ncbi:MAG: GntR family transcriptional regulator [Megasphaera sp.]|uniref:GntR family transcriptional regulator n=1 Tax=Megasphaera sueciensis TaxID=349094 RepID=UPI003D06D602|nr:GntR family transcriptional regulator [Megasphaera sp.]MCI1823261.1 GntR family transcriptional regulator [Megasphaera sp.]
MSKLEMLEQKTNESVREYAYRVIFENIMSLHLVPGTAISEKEISDRLSISRTPVREAFIRLAQAGLLEILPQRGTYISKIDTAQIAEFRFLRVTLERAVMELACRSFPESYLKRLEACLADQEHVLQKFDASRFYELDNEMHCIIFSGCAKPSIWQLLQNANINYIRARVLNVSAAQTEMQLLYEQHRLIMRSIVGHDVSAGIDIITKHVNKVIGDVDALKKQYPEYFK